MEEEHPKLKDFKTRDEGKVGAKVLVRSRLKIFGQGFIFVLRASKNSWYKIISYFFEISKFIAI